MTFSAALRHSGRGGRSAAAVEAPLNATWRCLAEASENSRLSAQAPCELIVERPAPTVDGRATPTAAWSACWSETTRRTPVRPRFFSPVRNARPVQERPPEHFVLAVADVQAEGLPTPVAGDPGGDHDGFGGDLPAAAATSRRLSAHVHVCSSRNTYGNSAWSNRRVRNAPTASSRPAQIRETPDLEIPDPPIATTRSSTARHCPR
jgi:hypothetical protein